MREILLQTLVEKVTAFQKQAQEIQDIIQALPDYTSALQQVNQHMDDIQSEIKAIPERISIPEQALQRLEGELLHHTLQMEIKNKPGVHYATK